MKKTGAAIIVGMALGFLVGIAGGSPAQAASHDAQKPTPVKCCPAAANGCCGG
jgi:hypothetical protein